VYFADIAGGFLGELNPATGEFKRYPTTGDPDESMVQIVVDSRDNVWMGLISTNKLGKLDASSREVILWDWPTPDTNPYGLIISHDDKVWTAGISKHMIVRFDPATQTFTEYATPTQPSAPRRLGEDDDGNIWWAEYSGGHVGVLDPRTGSMQQFAFPLAHSRGYDCWPVGRFVWMTEATYQTLVRFEPKTAEFVYYPLPSIQPSGNPGVPKIEVDPEGTIWFAYRGLRDRANPVVAFKPWGNAEK
jgi:virginiamycin B lyase